MFQVTNRWERRLWILAFVFYGIGDTVTTLFGLSTGGVAEAGPIAGPALEQFGAGGLLGVKVIIFVIFGTVWAAIDTPGRFAVPLALMVVGALVTAWNALVILTAF